MAKNPSKKAVGKDEPMNGAMKFFLAGCVAELYLLILRRFYVNAGSDVARFAWYDHYLWILAGVGAGVMAVCAVGALALRKDPKRRTALWIAAAAGLFLGAAALLVRWNMATLSFLSIVVPVIMMLGILWALYDRECALALTVLGASLFVLWGVRRYGSSMYVGTTVKVCVVIYLVLLAALAALTKSGKLNKLLHGVVGDATAQRISCRYMQPAVFPRWLCWPLCWAVASPTTPCGHWQRWSSHWLSTTRSSSFKM